MAADPVRTIVTLIGPERGFTYELRTLRGAVGAILRRRGFVLEDYSRGETCQTMRYGREGWTVYVVQDLPIDGVLAA